MSFLVGTTLGHLIVALVVGLASTLLVRRLWDRFTPQRVLLAVGRRTSGRLVSRLRDAHGGRPALASGGLENLLGPQVPEEVLISTANLIEDLDRYLPRILQHGERVSDLSFLIAQEMKLGAGTMPRLRLAGLLHDAGWLGVPRYQLANEGEYSDGERDRMKGHAEYSRAVAARLVSWMGPASAALSSHHERWDGKGYPNGLSGQGIPIEARIVAVADAFDAITHEGFGRPPRSVPEALSEISAHGGAQFDPQVVRALTLLAVRRMPVAVTGGFALGTAVRQLVASWVPTALGTGVAGASFAALSVMSGGRVAAPPTRPVAAPVVVTSSAPATATSTPATSRPTTTAKPPRSVPTTARPSRTTTPPPPSTPSSTPATPAPTKSPVPTQPPVTAAPAPVPTDPPVVSVPPPVTESPTVPPTPGNQGPRLGDDTAQVTAGGSVDIAVLSNDSDPDGSVVGASLALNTSPSLGSANVIGSGVRYTAGLSATGVDRFRYLACDDAGSCDTATVTVSVSPPPLSVNADSVALPAGVAVATILRPLDNDGGRIDVATLQVVSGPGVGRAVVSGERINYTLASGASAGSSTSIRYRVCDQSAACGEATITLRFG